LIKEKSHLLFLFTEKVYNLDKISLTFFISGAKKSGIIIIGDSVL